MNLAKLRLQLNDPAQKSKWKNIVYKKESENFKERLQV